MDSLTLLNPPDPNPVRSTSVAGDDCPFVLVGDHAGVAIPAALGDLGLSPADRARHIALDIGVQALGGALSDRLRAPFLSQAYSRLVVDCNRAPGDPAWMPDESDETPIPGNAGLDARQVALRRKEIFDPYHQAIAGLLDRREAKLRETVFVALHSFTPAMGGKARPWEVGVLHNGRRDDFALALLALLHKRGGLTVGDNEPYALGGIDYTVPHHAFPRGLRYLELEVRQDLLGNPAGIRGMTDLLAELLPAAL